MKVGEFDYYEGTPEGFHVGSWSPTPQADVDAGKPQAPATQVHLSSRVGPFQLIWRFKGPGTLDRLIDALIESREHTWGKRP